MTQAELQQLIAKLKSNPFVSPRYCDNCGRKHTEADLKLVSQTQGDVILQQTCQQCGVVQILRLSQGGGLSIQRIEVNNSDVKGAEFHRFAGQSAVEKGEALDVYSEMQKVENIRDFLNLIPPKSAGR